MPTLSDLVTYCDQRTRRTAYADAPGAMNGLQFANDGRVTKIGAAVDAGLVPFQAAAAAGIDFLIVHHGIFWNAPAPFVGPAHERLVTLVRANCAVYSSHLPLDGHPELGNNALIAKSLGLAPDRGWLAPPGGEPIGWIAPHAESRDELHARLRALYPRVTAIECGSARPSAVAICSGSGNSALPRLLPEGVDTLVTGELREEHFNFAQENRLNLYLCGHYATEVHGVRALAAELSAKFGLPWEFIATDNPL